MGSLLLLTMGSYMQGPSLYNETPGPQWTYPTLGGSSHPVFISFPVKLLLSTRELIEKKAPVKRKITREQLRQKNRAEKQA